MKKFNKFIFSLFIETPQLRAPFDEHIVVLGAAERAGPLQVGERKHLWEFSPVHKSSLLSWVYYTATNKQDLYLEK